MLKVVDIRSGYSEVTVLHGLTFDVKHEIYAILGANGAGKTTLMKTIAKVLPLSSGEFYFNDEKISNFAPYQIADKGLAFVPQERQVFPKMTVLENLSIGGLKLDKKVRKDKLAEVLDVFPDIKTRINQKAGTLSGGETQMVGLCRALMQEPKLILLDEPTSGLSPLYVELLFKKVREIHEEKGVSILITEQNATKALEIADKIMVLRLGKIHFIEDSKNVNVDIIKEGYHL